MESPQQPQLPRPVSRVLFQSCSKEAQTELLCRLPIREGELLSGELLNRTRQVLEAFSPRLEVLVRARLRRDDFLKLPETIRSRIKPPASDEEVDVIIYDPASLPRRIRVEGSQQEFMLLEKVAPACPPQRARDSETVPVELAVVVGKDGTVIDVSPLSGPEWLIRPAVDAVRHWRYRPTLLNGFPVEVQTKVTVNCPRTAEPS